jgi:hypothetical protein
VLSEFNGDSRTVGENIGACNYDLVVNQKLEAGRDSDCLHMPFVWNEESANLDFSFIFIVPSHLRSCSSTDRQVYI